MIVTVVAFFAAYWLRSRFFPAIFGDLVKAVAASELGRGNVDDLALTASTAKRHASRYWPVVLLVTE